MTIVPEPAHAVQSIWRTICIRSVPSFCSLLPAGWCRCMGVCVQTKRTSSDHAKSHDLSGRSVWQQTQLDLAVFATVFASSLVHLSHSVARNSQEFSSDQWTALEEQTHRVGDLLHHEVLCAHRVCGSCANSHPHRIFFFQTQIGNGRQRLHRR